MAFWNKAFGKKSRDAPNGIPTGRKTSVGSGGCATTLTPRRSRTADVLKSLRSIYEETEAIEFLKRVNPDVSMAVWNFVRLANQGHEMEFYSLDKKTKLTNISDEWREFAARINEISNSGLDGLIDQLHYSSFLLGAMGVEVEVTPDRRDIYDVYPVKPQTIEWDLKEIDGHKKYVPYQYSGFKKVYLDKYNANFFWVPADPDIGDPRGSLTMSPVLQAIDFQMQILQDLQAVLHHQGYPKNDIAIALEQTLKICPPHIRNNPKELRTWLDQRFDDIVRMLQNMEPDGDYVHYDDLTVNMNQGANAGRSLDVRAISELVDTQTLSGTKQMAIFMNRNQGVTESWGTVQFKIYCSGLDSCKRGSKRLVEEIARLWLRVKGIQAVPVFKHNILDWESEEQRMSVNLMKQEFYAVAQLMGWINEDYAAKEVMKVEKAAGKPIEAVRVSFSSGGGNSGNDKRPGAKLQTDTSETRESC
jgi:hypothetical protein